MIQYTEKGPGLHAAITRAGEWMREENGNWISSDDAAVQPIIDGYTLAEAIALRHAESLAIAKQLRDKAVAAISPGEMASWPIKLTEAARFAATGSAADAPMLAAEAAARGITLADLVQRVGAQSTGFATLEALIAGNDGRHRDAMTALTSFEALAAYDISTGWPAV